MPSSKFATASTILRPLIMLTLVNVSSFSVMDRGASVAIDEQFSKQPVQVWPPMEQLIFMMQNKSLFTGLDSSQQQQQQQQQQLDDEANNVTQSLMSKFYYHLFSSQDNLKSNDQATATIYNQINLINQLNHVGQAQKPAGLLFGRIGETNLADGHQPNDQWFQLETRRLNEDLRNHLPAGQEARLYKANYFKLLNRVFSRVELPEVFPVSRSRGSHCAVHVGCMEEIPNFPSLLKKTNISSSFTIYTGDEPRRGHRIIYEPLMHYQLQDPRTNEQELEDKLRRATPVTSATPAASLRPPTADKPQLGGFLRPARRQTASSWQTAARIIRGQEYPFDMAALEQSGFNASLNTRLIVGGYFAKEDEEWIDEVVRQWLLLEPSSNVIKVSWPEANRGLYHTAAYNSRIVARQLTLFLHYLDQMYHIDLSKFHLVGHSLGAHIAGFVGADNGGRIARITGLDPAGPIFVDLNASMRLDPSDARFVDVLHTNGGTITKGALGLSIPSGHVDYYCNGGSQQPGCYFSSVTRSILDPVERVACSHRRSYRYFIEIIKLAIGELHPANGTGSTGVGYPIEQLTASTLPRAFLFEAKQEELVKLSQPEILLLSSRMNRRELTDLAPLRRQLEFHLLEPKFPAGKRGTYFFRTRSEGPFFATNQYALTIRTESVVRRKMALMVKVDQTLVAEMELDEIPGVLTLAFAPNDPRIMKLPNRVPQLSLMWKHRSFNLLLNQQNELHLTGLELSQLDLDEDQPTMVIRYGPAQSSNRMSLIKASNDNNAGTQNQPSNGHPNGNDLILSRNQWHKFEGRLDHDLR